MTGNDPLAAQAAALLSRYLQFDTTNPPGAECAAAAWLAQTIRELDITTDVRLLGADPGRPAVIARVGADADGPALVLNHHIDVVPAGSEGWTHPPFSGAISDGYVWGRGALDCKGQGIIFLLALAQVVREGARFTRPVVYLAVPDEEDGGAVGMRWLVAQHLAELNPAWVWDEGSLGVTGLLPDRVLVGVSVAEKRVLQLAITAHGAPGHGSQPSPQSAPNRLVRALQGALAPRPVRLNAVTRAMWRAIAQTRGGALRLLLTNLHRWPVRALLGERLAGEGLLGAMLRDTISLTQLEAGSRPNVIPATARAVLDCRLLPDTDVPAFRAWLQSALGDDDLTIETLEEGDPGDISPLDGALYAAIAASVRAHLPGALVAPVQMPAASDARYFRQCYIPAYGLTPIVVDSAEVAAIHGVNERISLANLALGIRVTHDVIKILCTAQE